MISGTQLLVSVGVSVAVVFVSYLLRVLSASGAAAAFVVGVVVYGLGGGMPGLALGVMFVSVSALSRVGPLRWRQARSSRRDWVQIAANGLIACTAITLWLVCSDVRFRIAAVGALSAAAADTWATEVGRIAGRVPRLVTTWRRVKPGTSGGVSLIGTAGGAAGAVAVACAVLIRAPQTFWIVAVAGFSGMLVDSVLGATVQARYLRPDGAVVEKPEGGDRLAGGVSWMNNDTVNFAATVVGGVVAFALM
jgi:uncharacterized protein (TIGR00297 family)